ncbi:membrane associated rhomboid family serine protease [Peribacillus deserti]|uniref:Membrane associated rhomboid family serine protease n=1 Tax=Peribacillus deserti TaxID=673318 RepID=A0ABS2QNS7_9BACI|nr:rhomboid family intramembrane serine protease [Peribacillus deserti]MBM7694585.1 membrane associated rhomboid family serine protease [Peribacillus deserti]
MFARNENFKQFYTNYPAVTLQLTINFIFFLLTSLSIFPAALIFEKMSGVNLYIANGDYWRLLSPVFLHGSFSHFVFNSFSLAIFGPYIEKKLKPFIFICFYFTCGLFGNLATYVLEPLTFTHVGASGAIFGLLGYYMSLVCFKKESIGTQHSRTILTLFVVGVTMTFLQPQINIIGHLGGLISGFILSFLMFQVEK